MLADIVAGAMRVRVGVDQLRLLQRLDVPREHVLLGRVTIGNEAVLAHLEATIDFRELHARHLSGVLDIEPEWPESPDADGPGGVA